MVLKKTLQKLCKAKEVYKRLDTIESNVTWSWRTVVGALIVGAIGLILQIAKNGGI